MPRKRYLWIKCPKCKTTTEQRIISTVFNEDYQVLRRRMCLECELKWNTLQQPEQQVENITERTFLRKTCKPLLIS